MRAGRVLLGLGVRPAILYEQVRRIRITAPDGIFETVAEDDSRAGTVLQEQKRYRNDAKESQIPPHAYPPPPLRGILPVQPDLRKS